MSVSEHEGTVEFNDPSLPRPATTWYKVFGDLKSGKAPLLMLHGGPGACHEYLLPYTDLARDRGIPMIFYDQIGNGKGTRYPEKKGDGSFWTEQLFRNEIDNLVDHLGIRDSGFCILGQSWGGMLGASYAVTKPKGLKKLIIANSPASMDLWVAAAAELKSRLAKDVQEVLDRCEREKDFESPEYEKAVTVFYKQYLCRVDPFPTELEVCLEHLKEDSTTYGTMNGPSEFTVIGSLRNWSIIEDLHKIECPTLILNGYYDEAQDSCVAPYFEYIPKAKWVTFDNASHFSHVEQREKSMFVVGGFLQD